VSRRHVSQVGPDPAGSAATGSAATWVLARRIDKPSFQRINMVLPRNVVHVFRLTGPAEVDEEFAGWLAEAYQVGAQQHLRRPG
jgi:hypothetical protein